MVKIEWTEGATKDLERLDKPIARRILRRLAWFSKNFQSIVPEPLARELKGTFKLRIGDWSAASGFGLDRLSIIRSVNVLSSVVQEIVAATLLCHPADKRQGQVVFQNEDFQCPVFRNIHFPQRLENPVFVDYLNRLWHRYRLYASVARTGTECQGKLETTLFFCA